jgi:hypothetical protein
MIFTDNSEEVSLKSREQNKAKYSLTKLHVKLGKFCVASAEANKYVILAIHVINRFR